MNNDLISREALKEAISTCDKFACLPDTRLMPFYKLVDAEKNYVPYVHFEDIVKAIDNAPTVEPFERIGSICNENCGYNPQGDLAEKLNDRIEERVCKYCQMNKHCELCEISRVFSIIALTDKEMKEGAE